AITRVDGTGEPRAFDDGVERRGLARVEPEAAQPALGLQARHREPQRGDGLARLLTADEGLARDGRVSREEQVDGVADLRAELARQSVGQQHRREQLALWLRERERRAGEERLPRGIDAEHGDSRRAAPALAVTSRGTHDE